MSEPIRIDVCVCTFQRPHIAQTLRSLAAMELPEEYQMRVIVVDNDDTPSAQIVVTTTAEQCGLDVFYVHAPGRNISIARNACLDAATAPFVAFIDDDQLADTHWLVRLIARQLETGAEIVCGPAQALYPEGTPRWVVLGDFHSNRPVWVKGRILTTYTCNVLFEREAAALKGLRFREDLGITGGEDNEFFIRATNAGARIEYAADAVNYEIVPPTRTTMRWLKHRWSRYGDTHGMALAETRARSPLMHRIYLALSYIKAAFCWAVAPFMILHPFNTRRYILRGLMHYHAALYLKRHVHAA